MRRAKNITRKRKDIENTRFDLDAYEPVEMTTLTDEERGEQEVKMVHAFTLDGTEYFVPREVPYSVAVKSFDLAARDGEAAAIAYQLITLLGEAGYQALIGFRDIEPEQFKQVADLANAVIMASSGKAQ
jgi:hypothetical protein